ncbi:MAG: helix-turn-helix domain-containing protein [Legionellales bacterium]|nr:helix-turn-helix domain-containing protein [Legionellales bacterium]
MTDLSEIPGHEWNKANRRALAIRPLLELKRCPCEKAREVADELGLSERQIYRLIQRLRESVGEITALLPQGSHGGRGKQRLAAPREILLQRLIAEIFITPQKRSTANFIRAVRNQSLKEGLEPPSESTIRRRLKTLSLADRCKRGEQHPEIKPIYGVTPIVDSPLNWIQIDHTPVDLIIVDPVDRLPIGRPWITVAIDVFSRCIAGFHLTLEAPSATSVGLCLTMVATDKVPWLQERNIEAHYEGMDNEIPLHRYEQGLQKLFAANETLAMPRDPRTFLIDFLHAENNCYLEIPYRTLSRPTITLWEHKLARKRLREQRRAAVDEASLFAAIDEMREIESKSEALTRTARRNRTRRKNDSMKTEDASTPAGASASMASIDSVRPFEDIEPW